MKNSVYMGTPVRSWMPEKQIKYITFNVTDDCNLACTYCYFVHKNNKKRMTFDVAKRAVDCILADDENLCFDGVVWDFIGGEPSLEAELICQICDYIVTQMYLKGHKWLYCYKFMVCSNGLLYDKPAVQKIVKRYNVNFQISISIDGTKEKHDLSRKRKDGTGSYDDIVKILPLWMKQQGVQSTKATFAHDDLIYLKDSIINLWNLGLDNIMANVVFEDVWQEGDDVIYEKQLIELADYIIEHQLWDKYSVRFFGHSLGLPIDDQSLYRNFCGAGKMMAISTEGVFFPCMRFMESALDSNTPPLEIGDIERGVNREKLRSFYALNLVDQSDDRCVECEIASGCSWCSGLNYNCSENNTIFERKTYICKMHHANVRANRYFWSRFEDVTGEISPLRTAQIENASPYKKYAYVISGQTAMPFCQYTSAPTFTATKRGNNYDDILAYCETNNIIPIFDTIVEEKYARRGIVLTHYNVNTDVPFRCDIVNDTDIDDIKKDDYICKANSLIYTTSIDNIDRIHDDIVTIFNHAPQNANINLFLKDLYQITNDKMIEYIHQLDMISDYIVQEWNAQNMININVLTHMFFNKKHANCGAGSNVIAIDSAGDIYICPAFIGDQSMRKTGRIGNISKGQTQDLKELCRQDKLFLCRECSSNHCPQCIYINKKYTGEFSVPPEIQCIKSNAERELSIRLMKKLATSGINVQLLPNYSKLLDVRLDPLAAERPTISMNKYNLLDIHKALML